MTAYILGNGGHAHVVLSFLDRDDVRFVGLDKNHSDDILFPDFIENICGPEIAIFMGIGDNAVRRNVFETIRAANGRLSNCIAPNAFIAKTAEIGEGAFIGAGAIIGSRARLGINCIVNSLSSVDHDCILGDHSQVTGGVTFGGTVKTGERCFFGLRSCILPRITIGNGVTVMAGSVVTRDLPDGVTAGGYPARIARS